MKLVELETVVIDLAKAIMKGLDFMCLYDELDNFDKLMLHISMTFILIQRDLFYLFHLTNRITVFCFASQEFKPDNLVFSLSFKHILEF